MEFAAIDKFASIDKKMTGRDDTDPWYWQEDPFKLDSESPLAISSSFWEDLTQNEANSQSLFASTPPIVDTREPSPSYFSLDSQESDNISPSDYAAENGDRYKRRRMLHFTGAKEEDMAEESPHFEPTPLLDSTFATCINPLLHGGEEFLIPVPTSPSVLWYTRHEEPSSSSDQAPDKWMSRCVEDKETHNSSDDLKVLVPGVLVSEKSGGGLHSWQSGETEVLQGPLTPFSKGSTPGWKSSPLSRFKVKASTPVAYPFALVKPSGAQGDVTLNDINQRILSPPPRLSPHQSPGAEDRSPTHSGSGLSGKSVVACTKIHTEGNGTITIMRTRG